MFHRKKIETRHGTRRNSRVLENGIPTTPNYEKQNIEFASNTAKLNDVSHLTDNRKQKKRKQQSPKLVAVERKISKKVTPKVVSKTVENKNPSYEETLKDKLQDIRKRKLLENTTTGTNTLIRDGFVYLITNKAYLGWIKVGQTTDYEARLESYKPYSPVSFTYLAIRYVNDRRICEKKLMEMLKGDSKGSIGEWFKVKDTIAVEQLFNLE